MSLKYFFILFLYLLISTPIFGQVQPVRKDPIPVYKKIETYSQHTKFTKTLHKLIFRSSSKKKPKRIPIKKQQEYGAYHGKTIRYITIETLDPFGFSIEDSTKRASNWLGNVGNKIHNKSKKFAIRNLLLFKKNTLLDTLLITESKRLMRSQNFIRSVKIDVKEIHAQSDSIDVKVRVLDSWSLIPQGSVSTSKFNFVLKERNFLGFGHQFNNRLTKRFEDGKTAYSFEYRVPTIKETYINTTLSYQQTLDGFFTKKLNVERNFLSPLTEWAGGIYLDQRFRKDSLPNDIFDYENQNFKYNTQDLWVGHAFNIFKKSSPEGRSTNLITSVRLANLNYKETPKQQYDTINFFADELFYMGRIGVASRLFVEDAYIFRDGIVEDVPIGFAASITSGVQRKHRTDRAYWGANISLAKYSKWGYFNASLEYGTFINQGKIEQSALALEFNYFTRLIPLGDKWKMRQFVKPQILLGFNRQNTIADRLNLNDDVVPFGYDRNDYRRNERSGIPGFNADIYGAKKVLLSLQTQFYSPWNIVGFRLNPFLNITSGIMGKTIDPIYNNKIFTSLGAGVIIRNDYLVFSSFQFSFSYYPTIPGKGHNIFKTNSFETFNFGLQPIEIGKPSTVWFQ